MSCVTFQLQFHGLASQFRLFLPPPGALLSFCSCGSRTPSKLYRIDFLYISIKKWIECSVSFWCAKCEYFICCFVEFIYLSLPDNSRKLNQRVKMSHSVMWEADKQFNISRNKRLQLKTLNRPHRLIYRSDSCSAVNVDEKTK